MSGSNEYVYFDSLEYDTSITTDSPFPEWIATERIQLNRLTENELSPQKLRKQRKQNDSYYEYFTTGENVFGSDYDDVLDWYEIADEEWADRSEAFYVLRTQYGEFVGMAFFEYVDFSTLRTRLGIWIDAEHRGQGYSKHRAEALMAVAFEHLDLDVVEVEVVTENTASVSSVLSYMKELGGHFEGRIRNGSRIPSGDIKDTYLWSISSEEFAAEDAEYTTVSSPDPM